MGKLEFIHITNIIYKITSVMYVLYFTYLFMYHRKKKIIIILYIIFCLLLLPGVTHNKELMFVSEFSRMSHIHIIYKQWTWLRDGDARLITRGNFTARGAACSRAILSSFFFLFYSLQDFIPLARSVMK